MSAVFIILFLLLGGLLVLGFFRISSNLDLLRLRSDKTTRFLTKLEKLIKSLEFANYDSGMILSLRTNAYEMQTELKTPVLFNLRENKDFPDVVKCLKEVGRIGGVTANLPIVCRSVADHLEELNKAVNGLRLSLINPLALLIHGVKSTLCAPLALLGSSGILEKSLLDNIVSSLAFHRIAVVLSASGLLAAALSIIGK